MRLNNKILRINSLIVFLSIFLFSCAKQAEYIAPSQYPNTPEGNFEAFWNGIDQNYVFFTHHNLDWDAVYDEYKSQINSNTSDSKLYSILSEIFSKLIDNHRILGTSQGTVSGFNNYRHIRYTTSELIQSYYLEGDSKQEIQTSYTDPKTNQLVKTTEFVCGKINSEHIMYINHLFFGDALLFYSTSDELDAFIRKYNSITSSLILDMRNNSGGDSRSFYQLCSRFINSDHPWGFSQFRTGRERTALSPLIPEVIKPYGKLYYSKPIIVLVNRFSASAAEVTAIALKSLPNVIIMGDTTAGANGPISEYKDYTGNFNLPNKWKVQLAQRATLDADKRVYEGTGLPPDVLIQQSLSDFRMNKDNILDAAIKHLSKKN